MGRWRSARERGGRGEGPVGGGAGMGGPWAGSYRPAMRGMRARAGSRHSDARTATREASRVPRIGSANSRAGSGPRRDGPAGSGVSCTAPPLGSEEQLVTRVQQGTCMH